MKVQIWFVAREFENTVRGFIERASAIGRVIPLGRVALSHYEAARNLRKLVADQMVDRDDIFVFEMVRAEEGVPAFTPASLASVLRIGAHSTLDRMVESAYKILQIMRPTLPDYIYEQLVER
jgi:hypothetical protein